MIYCILRHNQKRISVYFKLIRYLHDLPVVSTDDVCLYAETNFDIDKNQEQVIDIRKCQYFPGYKDQLMPPVKLGQHNGLPHIVKFLPVLTSENESSLENIGKHCREYLGRNLLKHGAVLFKGLPLPSVDDFAVLYNSLDYENTEYMYNKGGTVSRPVDKDNSAFYQASATESPHKIIEPHNEQAYSDNCSGKVIFYGKEPAGPGCGGETILCHNRNLLKSINPKYVDKVIQKKLRYIRNCPDESSITQYKPWQETFHTNEKKEVERVLEKSNGCWEWRDNNWLHFWFNRGPLRTHPVTGEEFWFNQMTLASCDNFRFHDDAEKWLHMNDDECPTHVTYGDGEEIEKEFSRNVRQVTYDNSVAIKLERMDVLVIDNFQVQHGRMPFTGKRSITVALGK